VLRKLDHPNICAFLGFQHREDEARGRKGNTSGIATLNSSAARRTCSLSHLLTQYTKEPLLDNLTRSAHKHSSSRRSRSARYNGMCVCVCVCVYDLCVYQLMAGI
jgi:hypothetical protein